MIIKCTSCGSRYRVSDDLVADGPKRFKCKNCGAVLLIKPPAGAPDKPAAKPEAPKAAPAQADAPPESGGDGGPGGQAAPAAEEPPAEVGADGGEGEKEQTEKPAGETEGAQQDYGDMSPEEIAAQQQQDIQEKLEKRRQQMEDEISGRLNKAALETLDVDVLSELAHKIEEIQHNQDFHAEPNTKLFSCIKCKDIYCIYPDDSRLCANCPGEVSLVRAEDILKQFGMFG